MANIILRQTLDRPIWGYWDGGEKSVFTWRIEGRPAHDSRGHYVRIGSWAANHWFHVALGKTDKLTLANARRRLLAAAKRHGVTCKFDYKEEEWTWTGKRPSET